MMGRLWHYCRHWEPQFMQTSRSFAMPRWLGLSVMVIAVDQLTKALASHHLAYGISKSVAPGFDLTLLHNTGAAFSLLAHAGGWQQVLFVIVTLLVVGCLLYGLRHTTCFRAGLGASLVVGGALGNTVDRVVHQHVIDFIDVSFQQWHWPVFNLADAAICAGVVLLLMRQQPRSSST